MPDDTITLVSTTDTPDQVQQALTGKPVETPVEDKTPPGDPAPPAADAAAETPEDAPAEETPDAKPDRGRGGKRKQEIKDEIDELTGRKYSIRRDVEAEEARLMELRQQRQALEGQPRPPDAQPAATTANGGRPEPKLDAVDDKGDAKYATYEDYLSDHAVWTREEAVLAARQLIEQERHADRERIERDQASRGINERLASYNSTLATFKQAHADFDAAFEDAKDTLRDTLVAIGPQALKVVDGYTVFDAEDGPALTYYLLKRPDELKAIVMKSPPQQIAHLARIEERLRPASAKKTGPPVAVTAPETKAPKPIKPVGGGPTATTTVALDEAEFQDYRARREREIRARQGR